MPRRIASRDFNAGLQLGDVIMMLNGTGPASDSDGGSKFFEVSAMEAVPLLGGKGGLVVYSGGAIIPAGFTGDANAVLSGTLAAGVKAPVISLNSLILKNHQLFQFRTRVKVLAALGPAAHDIDVQLQSPLSIPRGGLPRMNSNFSMQAQAQDPGDSTVLPAQNANEALPAAFPGQDPWSTGVTPRTEMWTYKDQGVGVLITNNGSAAISGGAIVLEISGFLFNVSPIAVDANATVKRLAGYNVRVPSDVDLAQVTPIQTAWRDTQ